MGKKEALPLAWAPLVFDFLCRGVIAFREDRPVGPRAELDFGVVYADFP